MDSGLAAIIGASIGSGVTLLVSVVTPWIREALDRRRRAKEVRSAALFDAIRAVLVTTGTLRFRGRASTIEDAIALHEALVILDLHLAEDEYAVSALAVHTATLVRADHEGAPDALAGLQFVLPRWRSGELKTTDVRAAFADLTGMDVPGAGTR